MRTTLALVAAAIVVFVAGWLIDDVMLGDDLPRRISVAGIDIGGESLESAEARMDEAGLTDQLIKLRWAETTLVRRAHDLGVRVDFDRAIDDATKRGSWFLRPFRWAKSLTATRSYEVSYDIDSGVLAGFFGTDDDAIFPLDFGRPIIVLVDGQFVEADPTEVPGVDVAELERRVLAAAAAAGREAAIEIEVPVSGTRPVDTGADALIERASAMTEGGIRVGLLGARATYLIPEPALRSWIVFGGTRENPTLRVDHDQVQSTIESLFWGLGDAGEQAQFSVDNFDAVHIIGGAAGSVCCADDTPDRILAALESGEPRVDLLPIEDPDARGVAWAESLGIVELVGEFTTNFKPGQTRVINIDRIAELTQGAIIEPGDTFSINDYVGVRTRELGFVSAGVIADGVFETSVGGGISQYATTLFNAAFFAGLDFGEYQSHSIYIDRYPYGREATVSHPRPDLQIINTTPFGILVWPTTTEDSITVKLFSTAWVVGEQTDQVSWTEGVSCTRVETERTRTWVSDGRVEVDHVTARYRPEGRACNGSSTRPTTTTTTTTPPPSTSVPS